MSPLLLGQGHQTFPLPSANPQSWSGIQAVKMIESDHKIWQPRHVIAHQWHAIIRRSSSNSISSSSSSSTSSSGSSSSSRFKRLNLKYG